jgi:5-methyltetrahydropteroyltriglutamate--homocysteine methyltransferase
VTWLSCRKRSVSRASLTANIAARSGTPIFDKKIVLGLVTTKTGEMETADELKRRIEEAARYVPLEQLALSPQCGFSSTVLGNNISVEAEIAKLSLVVKVAGEVWG